MDCSSSNGRVDILGSNPMLPWADTIPIKDTSSYHDALTGNWSDTPLSLAYFSSANIRILQNGLKHGIYKKSNGQFRIGDQDTDELKIIMRSVYLQNSVNLETDIPQQINALNKIVLDYAVPQVYGEVQGYLKYKQDASTMYVPFPRIGAYSYTNDKVLELKKWF